MKCELEQLERLRSEIPHAAPWSPTLVIPIRLQVKTRQSQSYKLKKKCKKNANFEILQETFHTTHLLKLLDKMYKYEMDPTRTVGATERTRDAGRTDGQADGRTECPTTSLCGRYKNECCTPEGNRSLFQLPMNLTGDLAKIDLPSKVI